MSSLKESVASLERRVAALEDSVRSNTKSIEKIMPWAAAAMSLAALLIEKLTGT